MPTTTNFGWTTPADTDLVKDGASAIRTLGNGIDTSFLDLKGGTTGQVLSKASNTDLDFTWSSADPLQILDAKGDLISATAADTPARLPVGTNGQYLSANSSASTGLQWVTPAAVTPPLLIPLTSGNYIKSQMSSLSQAGIPQNTTHYIPIYLTGTTYDRISFRTGASQSGSSTVRLGIYNVDSNNKPSTLVLDAGTVAANAASTLFEITINQTLTANYYYLAICSQSATQLYAMYGDGILPYGGYAGNMNGVGVNNQIFTQSGVTGAFANAGTLTQDNLQVFMGMRIA